MDEKIDNGKIIKRFRKDFNKISFPHKNEFGSFDLFTIYGFLFLILPESFFTKKNDSRGYKYL